MSTGTFTTLDVGTSTSGAHLHVAEDGSVTLYGTDGVQVLAILSPDHIFSRQVSLIAGNRTDVLLKLKAAALQTANLIEITDDQNNLMASFGADFALRMMKQVFASNLAVTDDAVEVTVTMPTGVAPNGSKSFLWPKKPLGSVPLVNATIVDGAGTSIDASVRVTGVTDQGGTALVHYKSTLQTPVDVKVHVRAYCSS